RPGPGAVLECLLQGNAVAAEAVDRDVTLELMSARGEAVVTTLRALLSGGAGAGDAPLVAAVPAGPNELNFVAGRLRCPRPIRDLGVGSETEAGCDCDCDETATIGM